MPKLQKTTVNGQPNGHPNGPINGNTMNGSAMNGNAVNGGEMIAQPALRSALAQHRQVHPMQAKLNPNAMNGQQIDPQAYYSNGPPNAIYNQKQQQLALHLNAQQINNVPQQNGNNSSQQFHPTHKRSRPLSILYKPSPVITTQPENV